MSIADRIIAECNAERDARQRRVDANPITRAEWAKIDSQIMANDRAALEKRIDSGVLDILNWRQR